MSEREPCNQLTTLSDENIWDIFHLPRVAANVRRMYRASHELRQETGFAVYDKGDRYQTSRLLVPTISEEIDTDEAYSIDMSSLTRERITSVDDFSSDELRNDNYDDLRYSLSRRRVDLRINFEPNEAIAQKIEAIKKSYELDEKSKERLVETIIEREISKQEDSRLNMRSDIVLLAHNHPLHRQFKSAVYSYMPSPADLHMYAHTSKGSPRHIEAIVSSNGQSEYGMMLYGIPWGTTDKSGVASTYEGLFESIMGLPNNRQIVALLGRAGCSAAFIPMRPDGTPETDGYEQIFEFADSLKY